MEKPFVCDKDYKALAALDKQLFSSPEKDKVAAKQRAYREANKNKKVEIMVSDEQTVRRDAFDLYGRSMVDMIQRVEPGVWKITLTDGGISWATVQDDGSICIDP